MLLHSLYLYRRCCSNASASLLCFTLYDPAQYVSAPCCTFEEVSRLLRAHFGRLSTVGPASEMLYCTDAPVCSELMILNDFQVSAQKLFRVKVGVNKLLTIDYDELLGSWSIGRPQCQLASSSDVVCKSLGVWDY